MSLSTPFIERPVATTLLTIGVALAGLFAFGKLPVAPLPQVDFPTISVFAQMPGKDFPRLEVVPADNKYHNHELDRWLRVHRRPYHVWVISRPPGERRFKPLRSRWVVERTLAWLGRYRRLSKDYEHLPESSEAVIKIAAIHHYLRRLCPDRRSRSQRCVFVVVDEVEVMEERGRKWAVRLGWRKAP